jgi:hypothetical protein
MRDNYRINDTLRNGTPPPIPEWLPPGKSAAVCFTIDDVHPRKSTDDYEAGGDLGEGALKRVLWLLNRHQDLKVTLFIAADLRTINPLHTRRLLARLPYIRDRVFLTRVLPKGTMRIDRHPEFVRFLSEMPRTQIGLHGLYHVHKGLNNIVEFQDQDVEECKSILQSAMDIFQKAGLSYVPGMCPPAWNLTQNLAQAMVALGLKFVASARDVHTPVSQDAVTGMSGMRGVSLIYPQFIQNGRLVHLTSNFAANNSIDRALKIIDHNGLLAVKAHINKYAFGYVSVDGLEELYSNYLDLVFSELEERYGDSLWWTSMDEIAERVLKQDS